MQGFFFFGSETKVHVQFPYLTLPSFLPLQSCRKTLCPPFFSLLLVLLRLLALAELFVAHTGFLLITEEGIDQEKTGRGRRVKTLNQCFALAFLHGGFFL